MAITASCCTRHSACSASAGAVGGNGGTRARRGSAASAAGSLEWIAGAGFVLAIVIGVLAPALQFAGLLAPVAFLHAGWIQVLGIALAVAGMVATLYAQVDMGESWRIGVDPGETTALVRKGVFGVVRNPIFSAMSVFGAGIALVTPNPLALAGFVLLVATVELQVRVVEEPYLARVHGNSYRDYVAAVGRFVPKWG